MPSNRKRTEARLLPWRSQKAFMSFDRAVVRLILKKTSLLLSVTFMFRCSDLGWSSGFPPPAPGDWSRSDMLCLLWVRRNVKVVRIEAVW